MGGGVLVAPLPEPTLPASVGTYRALRAGTPVPVGPRPYVMLGAMADFGLVLDGRVMLPLVGVAGYGTMGELDAIVSQADGSVARVFPWTTARMDLLGPGLGFRGVHRRFAGSAVLRVGATFGGGDGEVSEGAVSHAFEWVRASVLVQAELAACRRLDPVQRVCLTAAPRIHDFGWLTGASFGLRWEFGR